MLKNKELRIEIIQLYYNILVARYKERQKITELIIRNYQQPRITRDIKKYVNGYNICQLMKNRIEI